MLIAFRADARTCNKVGFHDFGSILRSIEHNFSIEENFADERSRTNLTSFFDLDEKPRRFREISAPKKADFFLNDKRPATDPDDDDLPTSP